MQFQMAQKSGKSGVGRHLVDTPGMPSTKEPGTATVPGHFW